MFHCSNFSLGSWPAAEVSTVNQKPHLSLAWGVMRHWSLTSALIAVGLIALALAAVRTASPALADVMLYGTYCILVVASVGAVGGEQPPNSFLDLVSQYNSGNQSSMKVGHLFVTLVLALLGSILGRQMNGGRTWEGPSGSPRARSGSRS